MKIIGNLLGAIFLFLCIACTGNVTGTSGSSESGDTALLSRRRIAGIIYKVNDYWQKTCPEHGNAFWHHAVYHIGNLAAYRVTGEKRYADFSKAWAEKNRWCGATSSDRTEWKYSYGETDDYVLFGDWQACFQVYADLYFLEPDEKKIARAQEVVGYQMSTPQQDYWWWADGLYMAMPVMTRLFRITGDSLLLQKQYEYFAYARRLMYDPESDLFYRDAKYIYPRHATENGKKDFWARGNGWVIAALAKVLDDYPSEVPYREEYLDMFCRLAASVAAAQQPEGYWTRSMWDPRQAPGPETSGTAFFTYGLVWGINRGVLDKKIYGPVAEKAWHYLVETALQPDGHIGYVQPIGEKAIPGQVIDRRSTADFGVGAFLLAASEMMEYATPET